jgi:uncharacterized protein YkwD
MFAALLVSAALSAGPCDLSAAQTVVNDVNLHRVQARVQTLVVDPQLTAIARDRAADLARRHYFSHVSPDGATAIDALRGRAYAFAYAGENLAMADTVQAADEGLWQSPDHRENILESHYRRVGIAVLDTDEGNLIVQIFSD